MSARLHNSFDWLKLLPQRTRWWEYRTRNMVLTKTFPLTGSVFGQAGRLSGWGYRSMVVQDGAQEIVRNIKRFGCDWVRTIFRESLWAAMFQIPARLEERDRLTGIQSEEGMSTESTFLSKRVGKAGCGPLIPQSGLPLLIHQRCRREIISHVKCTPTQTQIGDKAY